MGKIESVQVLRAYAASLVVVDHLIIEGTKLADPLANSPSAWVLGAFGVDIFFVISGFIMFFIGAQAFGKRSASRMFFQDRITRVVPLYWIATIVWVALNRFKFPASDVVHSLFFMPYQNLGEGGAFPVLSVGWTLQYEMAFYALFSLSLFARQKVGVILLLCALALSVLLHELYFEKSGILAAEYFTRPIIGFFLVGVGLGVAKQELDRRDIEVVLPGKAFLLAIGCLGYASIVLVTRYEMHQSSLGDSFYKILAISLVSIAVLTKDAPLTSFVKVASRIGDASYSLYLFHLPVIFILVSVVTEFKLGSNIPVFVLLGFFATVGVSLIMYRYVERPLSGWLHRRSKPARTGGHVPPASDKAIFK